MKKSKRKCSFDWDDTAGHRKDVQHFISLLIKLGWDVWIVTSRYDTANALLNKWTWVESDNDDLFELSDILGIKRENIVFTNYADKIDYLAGKGFLFHVDDSPEELMKIRESNDPCYPICVDYFAWEEDLIKKFNILK